VEERLGCSTSRSPPEEAEEPRAKGFRFPMYRPDEDEFRLSLPLQTIEERVQGTLTIEQG
jgi:hypothetical protein